MDLKFSWPEQLGGWFTGGIPDLQFDWLTRNLHDPEFEVDTDGREGGFGELTVDEPDKQGGLAHGRRPHYDNLNLLVNLQHYKDQIDLNHDVVVIGVISMAISAELTVSLGMRFFRWLQVSY